MKIGKIAKQTGIPVDTIRYYEKMGLLHAPLRNSNGYRSYNNSHLERLRFIRRCRSLDMSQDEIRQLIHLSETQEADCSEVDALVAHHLQHVRERLQELAQLEQTLVQLQTACASGKAIRECGILAGLHTDLELQDIEAGSHVPGIHGANQDKH
ncbi:MULTISPECIES: Cd(II)/Pb(II)-responsive transcriptional regulator [Marinobacterium]|uniref:Cd(II)/Pb(II)-responsive transcriptional regulator n=2 Tax=Marinobacterium TaxID=48075 RepID=A0ABN1I6H6_9GAMM|nr:Cd(II)/Pb(II)-responsive transcriptional regulator [Marinobacterium sediminicola]ULG68314.1 Cd(II)/Pb(II)-responsive transcriptional regulator [Marinobacterium sediminicola]SMR74821.1 Cd(II)/Pb(II)-responsive transcriptional regulator [Marinobacterium sediminicola]